MGKNLSQTIQDLQNSISILQRQSNNLHLAEITRNKILLRIEIQKQSITYFLKGYNFAIREIKDQEKLSKEDLICFKCREKTDGKKS